MYLVTTDPALGTVAAPDTPAAINTPTHTALTERGFQWRPDIEAYVLPGALDRQSGADTAQLLTDLEHVVAACPSPTRRKTP